MTHAPESAHLGANRATARHGDQPVMTDGMPRSPGAIRLAAFCSAVYEQSPSQMDGWTFARAYRDWADGLPGLDEVIGALAQELAEAHAFRDWMQENDWG